MRILLTESTFKAVIALQGFHVIPRLSSKSTISLSCYTWTRLNWPSRPFIYHNAVLSIGSFTSEQHIRNKEELDNIASITYCLLQERKTLSHWCSVLLSIRQKNNLEMESINKLFVSWDHRYYTIIIVMVIIIDITCSDSSVTHCIQNLALVQMLLLLLD